MDAAGVLSPAVEQRLFQLSAELEQRTGHQLVVVTTPSLNGRDVKDYTRELGNAWGIGRAKHDDGVVFLVAPVERKTRIAVGLGLEQILTNAEAERILETLILPAFRRGDLAGGVEAGSRGIIDELHEPKAP